ncbi:MAG: signal transduction histidine kinase [Cryomorphaceae bacterium]|jgi:signal transduction histidine kinase
MTSQKDTTIESELDKVYDTFIKVTLMAMDLKHLGEVVSPDINGFGTTIDEKINNATEYRDLVKKQIKASENADFKFHRQSPRKQMLAGGLAALFVEELEIQIGLPDGSIQIPLRLSTALDQLDGQWKVIHFHGSTPVMSEDDTFHINDWEKKNQELEAKVTQKTAELEASLEELKATQTQLVVQEKLAALGQLAAGIAHEIKNPMNFVNNFSELSLEYIDEIKEEVDKLPQNDTTADIKDLLEDVSDNLKKIHQHGTRADSIVKSMLMHSRGGSGILEPTDLNELLGEYVNLAFHGMRAGKNPINVKLNYDLDESVGSVPVFPEDFSRVVLNLCKNAFDAMRDKFNLSENGNYLPELMVKSAKDGNKVLVTIEDNGPGITDQVRDKLFEPFFTTKKGTEGTGLGLSITHDIIKNHKGHISIESSLDDYTRFIIELPITKQTQ